MTREVSYLRSKIRPEYLLIPIAILVGALLLPFESLAQDTPDPTQAALEQTIEAAVRQTLSATIATTPTAATAATVPPAPVVARSVSLSEVSDLSFTGHEGAVNALDFGPGGVLATGGADGKAYILPVNRAQTLELDHQSGVQDVLFSPDGDELFTVTEDGLLHRWSVETGEAVDEPVSILETQTNTVVTLLLGFNEAGTQFTTFGAPVGEDGTLTTWSYPDLEPTYYADTFSIALLDYNTEPATVAYTQTGNESTTIFSPLDDLGEDQIASIELPVSYSEPIAFSEDGTRVLIAGDDNRTRIADTQTGEVTNTYEANGVGLALFNPSGTLIADLGSDGGLYLLDAETGLNLTVANAHTGAVQDADFSINGELIATAGDDGIVRVWRLGSQPQATPAPQTALSAEGTPLPDDCPQEVDAEVQVAEQVFESGRMFWVQPVNQIWVMELTGEGSGQWFVYQDTFEEGEEIVIPPEQQPQEAGLYLPERGFGKLWAENPDVRQMLGYGTTPEFGYVSRYRYIPGIEVINDACEAAPGVHVLFSLDSEEFRFFEEAGTWRLGE